MSQQVFDIDTVGFSMNGIDGLGSYFDFCVNNVFYLLAPEYYFPFYSIYLNRCLSVYDGWVNGWHNIRSGLVPQRMLQSLGNGLNNMLFAHGIDFAGRTSDYNFATEWAKRTKFYKALKKAHKFGIAGGTSLMKLNRVNKELFMSAHRIDTFFADIDASGKVVSVQVFFDAIHNTNPSGVKTHYGICEERYFNEDGKPVVRSSVYMVNGNLQTEVASRQKQTRNVTRKYWLELPRNVKKYILDNYPDIVVDKEIMLPFHNSIGCYLMRFTDDIPQIPNTPFGQPIGDILFTENFQYDQMKYFEKNEVDLARARALLPEELWNKDDPLYGERALNERFYQKVASMGNDNDKVTPLQFLLRGEEIRKQKENIYKDIGFKLQVSASSVATFLNEGAGARTATEIISERTKSSTWINGQINLNAPEINEMLRDVMYFYNRNAIDIILRPEDQSPFLDKLKVYSDVFSAGNMSAERFVRGVYGNLSQAEQAAEIEYLKNTRAAAEEMQKQTELAWNGNAKSAKTEEPEDMNMPLAERKGEISA